MKLRQVECLRCLAPSPHLSFSLSSHLCSGRAQKCYNVKDLQQLTGVIVTSEDSWKKPYFIIVLILALGMDLFLL